MSSESCRKVEHVCEVCWEYVTACLTHDDYFVCAECGCRMRIDKEKFLRDYNLMFRKAIGEKPDKPENN